jgi:uncharacterized membrane protein (DUF373 family)
MAVLILVAVVLAAPMNLFIILDSQKFSPRQIAAIGFVNMAVGLTLLWLAYRKWIRNMR